jgi:hypothetical protein
MSDHPWGKPFSEIFAEHVAANDAKPLPKLHAAPHPHTALVKQTVDALKKLPGNKIVRKRPVGRFIVADGAGNPRKIPGGKWQYVRVAVAGDADVECIWLPPGAARPVIAMLEIKTGSAVLSPDQKEAREQALACGCVHIVVRSAAQAFEDVLVAAKSGGGRLL